MFFVLVKIVVRFKELYFGKEDEMEVSLFIRIVGGFSRMRRVFLFVRWGDDFCIVCFIVLREGGTEGKK